MLIQNQDQIDKYYQALVDRDTEYIGIFYVGVKTTGVFCISTCRARKPKKKNVVFYTQTSELLQHGFRPCKICKPTENAHQPPDDIIQALDLLKDNPHQKIKDQDLREQQISPDKVRRWFKKHHGVTFHAYQRMIRINNAFRELKNGNTVTGSAFDSGYDSLSGFGYMFKNMVGSAPQDSTEKTIITITRLTSPLGPMFACATDKGICLLEFTDRRMLETEFKDLQKRLDAIILAGDNEHLVQLRKELKEYFEGSRKEFQIRLHTPGTDFQNKVWRQLTHIPYGKTRSYQEQAEAIGQPKAVRAVATANGFNRVAIVIPCHRVIGKDGSLTGYGGGLERKKWLIEHEQKN